jgi:hypothetical protein
MASQIQSAEHKREPSRQRAPAKPVSRGPVALAPAPNLALLRRAIADPRAASPRDILALQRLAGNRAVTRLIQTKLAVGPAGDKYEQEADRVAEQVVSGQPSAVGGQRSAVSRQAEEEEEIQTKPLAASITPLVQRQVEEEEEEVQAKPLVQRQAEEEEEVQTKALVQRRTDGGFEAGPEIESRLAAQRGGGSPLPDEVRAAMEPPFGADFSGVRVHTGGEADRLNRELSAEAFTHGQDIYMRAGKYTPGTPAGNRLLAHELTHVVQQSAGQVRRDIGTMVVRPTDAAQEQTSEAGGHDFSVTHSPLGVPAGIQRTLDQHIDHAQIVIDHQPFAQYFPLGTQQVYLFLQPNNPAVKIPLTCQTGVTLAWMADQNVLGSHIWAAAGGPAVASQTFGTEFNRYTGRLQGGPSMWRRRPKQMRHGGDIVYWQAGRGTEHFGIVMGNNQDVGGYNQNQRVQNGLTPGFYNADPPLIGWAQNDDERAVYRP